MAQRFKVGDKVTPVHDDERVPNDTRGRVFTVRTRNPKKVKCDADDGGRGINFPDEILRPATDENVKLGQGPFTRPYVPPVFFDIGEIVTLTRPYKDITVDTPMVVIADKQRVNVTKLGGDDGQYLRANRENLVKRDLAWLREELSKQEYREGGDL